MTNTLHSLLWFCFLLGPIPDGANVVVWVKDTEQIENASVESKRVKILVQTNEGVDIRPVVWFIISLE